MELLLVRTALLYRTCQKPSRLNFFCLRWSSTTVKESTEGADYQEAHTDENNKSSLTEDELKKISLAKPLLQRDILNHAAKTYVFKQAQEVLYRYPADGLDFDWPSKWPTSRPFNPYLVPLPIRMGFPQNKCVTPDKFSNLELMKVENFLHLTPPAIEKHCAVLKDFCTPFPEKLKSDEACEKAFPVETHSVDYIDSGSSVKDTRARTVTKKIRLSSLVLNDHARRKMTQLLGKDRYDKETDIATIKVQRCPTKKQNSDFINYVLTALYFESWAAALLEKPDLGFQMREGCNKCQTLRGLKKATEKWEVRESMDDYDCYYWWEDSVSHKNLKNIFEESDDDLLKRPEVKQYRQAVTAIKQEVEPTAVTADIKSKLVDDYKQSVLKLLNLTPLQ